ncbi:MAG TPA: right-handed parallel beta-helix repeat-containing protein [Propionicimonas sp.]|nr:right-handed parallel beta-helix repeat-containing protein [Propionicimonas sp.]
MTRSTLRATAVLVALATTGASLLATATIAAAETPAETTVEAAASTLGLSSYALTELTASGDITSALKSAVSTPGTSYQANVVHLPAGSVIVSATIRPANHVYLVADPGTTITWRGSDGNLLRFNAGMTGGVTGGTWDGAGRSSTTLVSLSGASVQLADLTVTDAGKHGIGAYEKSTLTLSNVTSSYNKADGVHLEGSTLVASGLRSVYNRRNGLQLSTRSVGTISASTLDRNGQAVKGSTDGKTGHGLGVASSTAVVYGTTMSRNKVCGASLADAAKVEISRDSHLDNNGRHGLGTTPGAIATITDSSLNHNGYNGALASGKGTVVTLRHVTIDWAKKMGLSVPSGGAATVSDSVITQGQKHSISVSAKGKLTLLGGNTISASRSGGITVSGRGSITISGAGNLVTGNRGDGLRITGSGTKGWIRASTRFAANRDSGIVVASKARLWMVVCDFSGNKRTVAKQSGGKWYRI